MDSAESLVDLIFAKCSLVYGRDFLSRWEGQDMAEVKADWRRELGPILSHHPQAVMHALLHMPADKPPNVLQFRALCINRPEAFAPALPAPSATPERKAEVRSLLQLARERITRNAA